MCGKQSSRPWTTLKKYTTVHKGKHYLGREEKDKGENKTYYF